MSRSTETLADYVRAFRSRESFVAARAPDRDLVRRNPLLALWHHLAEPYVWMNNWRYFQTHDEPPPMWATMRASRARRRLRSRYAWAIPNDAALRTIAPHAPILELGAGTGYWAWLLRREYGVDILAYDRHLPGPRHPFGHRRTFVPVLRGGPRKAKQFSDRTLFLCWPPYDTDFGVSCLRHYRGQTVVYIGEDEGGCNATPAFFDELAARFQCTQEVEIPQWDGLHDRLTVWTTR